MRQTPTERKSIQEDEALELPWSFFGHWLSQFLDSLPLTPSNEEIGGGKLTRPW